jgi:hypothetical protein
MRIYVLLETQENGIDRPVAVTQNEVEAEKFYQANTKDRDVIPFVLDEIPMMTGQPATPPPDIDPAVHSLNETTRIMQDTSAKMQEALKKLKERKKK